MQVCISLQTDNHASIPPLKFLTGQMPFLLPCPTNSVKALKAHAIKVVVSKKWCEIDTLLLHTTNSKYHIAYLFVPFPVTLDDLDGYLPNAGLIRYSS